MVRNTTPSPFQPRVSRCFRPFHSGPCRSCSPSTTARRRDTPVVNPFTSSDSCFQLFLPLGTCKFFSMGRQTDSDVHAAFVEFRAKGNTIILPSYRHQYMTVQYLFQYFLPVCIANPRVSTTTDDDKCLSVQCIYCQQIRAKNTSRQKTHLLECPGLQNNPNAPRPQSSSNDVVSAQHPFGTPAGLANSTPTMTNGLSHTTPMQSMPSMPPRQSLPPNGPLSSPMARPPLQQLQPTSSPKLKNPKPVTPASNLPAPALDDVHAAFVEFRAKEEDKCLSVQCIYCNQIRAKNTSRQRQHLLECPTYLNVMKDAIPANNLFHKFDEGDIARSLQLPQPALELDFRMSIKLNPKIALGAGPFGQRNWVSFVAGQWAGRWGKGIVVVSHQIPLSRPHSISTQSPSARPKSQQSTNHPLPHSQVVKTVNSS